MSGQGSLLGIDVPRGVSSRMAQLYPFGFGAELSEDGLFRFTLWRNWAEGPHALFIALNPSTADAREDDQTIQKEVEFSRRWGLAAMRKVNTSPLRSTDPSRLLEPHDAHRRIAEAKNLDVIRAELRRPGLAEVVVAWGAHVEALARGELILQLVRESGHHPMCLGTTKGGHPAHPCRLAYATPLTRFKP